MSDVLQSVRRLTTLAHVGPVTIAAAHLDAPPNEAMADAVRVLRDAMRANGLTAMDIATTITDTEFLRLAALLTGTSTDGIVAAARGQSIWNVRLRTPGDAKPATTGPRAVEALWRATPAPSPSRAVSTTEPPNAPPEREQAVRDAVQRGDGDAVCRALADVTEPGQFVRAATPVALQMVAERLLEDQTTFADVTALLERAAVPGAKAVFEQMVAASDMAERRLLYDIAASLPATVEVARQYLTHPIWYVVRNAAGLLGESRSVDAIPDLARLLKHGDDRVRVAAVVALGHIGGPLAIARLESVLLDSSPEVRNRALALVFASPDGEALQSRVAAAYDDEASLDVQLETIGALAHVRTPRARQRLETLCLQPGRGPDPTSVRIAAMNALAAGHRPEADATLKRLVDDPIRTVRERAAVLLT